MKTNNSNSRFCDQCNAEAPVHVASNVTDMSRRAAVNVMTAIAASPETAPISLQVETEALDKKIKNKDGEEVYFEDTEIALLNRSMETLLPDYFDARRNHHELHDRLSQKFQGLSRAAKAGFLRDAGLDVASDRWSALDTAIRQICEAMLRETPLCLEHAAMQAKGYGVLECLYECRPGDGYFHFANRLCDSAGVKRIPEELIENEDQGDDS